MAYHKTKHAEAAQKYLHQGKIAQAVAEYQIILKHEPKDQVTLMTVGDLFVRQGETFQALEYFERLAQIYLSDGFLTKAIAIYKKITKLAPEETRPVERLADLYVQQGVMSEARPIYLQLAEMHQRAQRPAQAAGLLRKLLDAEPDNVRVQSRLAELSMSMGQPAEAVAALRTAAQQLHRRGDHAEAIVFADRALKIDGADGGTLALRARALVGAGKHDDAVKMLESLRDLDAGGEAAGLLVDLYLEAGDTGRASALAERIVARDAKRYAVAQRVATSLLEASQAESALAILRLIRQAMVEAGEQERFAELLVRAAEALPKEIEPREMLVEVYRHTSDSFRLPDALIHLAEVYEAAGQPGPACKTYEQYLERDPENEAIRHRHERVQARLGQAGHGADAAVAPAAEEAEPPAAPGVSEQGSPDQGLDEETRLFVSQALTDVDLYSSYGLTQKALDLLDIVLQRAPNHTVALERLLDLSLGLGDETRTVELAARLEQIYGEYGDKTAAERFADLRRRFERNAGVAAPAAPTEAASQAAVPAEPAGPMEFAIPVVDAEPEPANGEAGEGEILSESVVHEVDLSEEWAAVAGQAGETTMVDPAEPAGPDQGVLQESDVGAGPLAEELFAEYELAVDDAAASGPADGSPESVDSFIRSISAELDAILPAPASTPSGPAGPASALGEGAADLTEAVALRARDAQTGGPLGDLFDQFRADLGETSEKEDPETHYNLGIAYREMGLLEEAISEFQKVAKAHQRGQALGYAMQCYTLLALAFVDKGQPSIAVTWYERALAIPDLEQESVLALRYDLGVAQEMAGDMEAAHKSFSQVYGTNIDYRDVAERLAALGRAR